MPRAVAAAMSSFVWFPPSAHVGSLARQLDILIFADAQSDSTRLATETGLKTNFTLLQFALAPFVHSCGAQGSCIAQYIIVVPWNVLPQHI